MMYKTCTYPQIGQTERCLLVVCGLRSCCRAHCEPVIVMWGGVGWGHVRRSAVRQ